MGKSTQGTQIWTWNFKKWRFHLVVAVSYLESYPSNAENLLFLPDSSPGGSWTEAVFQNQISWITKAIIIKNLQGSLFRRLAHMLGKV